MAKQKSIDGANLQLALKQNNEKMKGYIDASHYDIKKYQKYVNTELDYCYLRPNITAGDISISEGFIIPFIVHNGNMEYNPENYSVKLKGGKTYKIESDIYSYNDTNYVNYILYDITNNVELYFGTKISANLNNNASQDSLTYVYTPIDDCEIQIKINTPSKSMKISADKAYFSVQEINRQITIDPVEHVNESQGIEDTPVGHIISHMGTVAPKHYLICDGAEYNITDYPYLAQHIEDNFGSVNYFGGNGVNTFAVPLEEKEYVWNKNATLTSATQYSYYSPSNAFDDNASSFWHSDTPQGSDEWIQVDFGKKIALSVLKVLPRSGYVNQTMKNFKIQGSNDGITYNDLASFTDITEWTSDIYNTFILKETAYYSIYRIYITAMNDVSVTISDLMFGSTKGATYIKYEPTYFMNTYNTNYMQPSLYSEEERVVGCWIDGKPLYQKTFKTILPEASSNGVMATTTEDCADFNIDIVTSFNGFFASDITTNAAMTLTNGNGFTTSWYNIEQKLLYIGNGTVAWNGRTVYLTIQYTKTTDEENSFTNDMLKDSYVELTYTDEEIYNEVASILSSESSKGE